MPSTFVQERSEYVRFTREQIEDVLKCSARMRLIGTIYYGRIGEQDLRWLHDGSVEVVTHHAPAPRGAS